MPDAEITFELVGIPPTPNKPRHWTRRHKDNQQWKSDTWLAATNAIRLYERGDGRTGTHLALPLQKPTVTVTFLLPDLRRRDADNLIAAIKPCLDGIVLARLAADDSLGEIEVVHKFEIRRGRPGLRFAVRSGA